MFYITFIVCGLFAHVCVPVQLSGDGFKTVEECRANGQMNKTEEYDKIKEFICLQR